MVAAAHLFRRKVEEDEDWSISCGMPSGKPLYALPQGNFVLFRMATEEFVLRAGLILSDGALTSGANQPVDRIGFMRGASGRHAGVTRGILPVVLGPELSSLESVV